MGGKGSGRYPKGYHEAWCKRGHGPYPKRYSNGGCVECAKLIREEKKRATR